MMQEPSFRAAFILILIAVISCGGRNETSTQTAAISSAASASAENRRPAITLSQNDLRRMFAYERRENFIGKAGLWDATTGKKLIEDWPKGETSTVVGDPSRILIGCATCPDRKLYSNDGVAGPALKIDPVARNISFSPDARRVVFEKNSDLWIADVDWPAGAVRNPRQLTHVGVFNNKTSSYWNGDHLLYGAYRISLTAENVNEAPVGWFRLEKRIAPDGGAVIGARTNNQLYVYDVALGQATTLMDGVNIRDYLWLDARRAVMIHGNRDLLLFDRSTAKATKVITGLNLQDGLSAPSPDGRFVFATEFMGLERMLAIDTTTWTTTPVSKDILGIAWLTPTTFLFKRSEPIEKRGTWIFDMGAKTERKVSPYPWDSIAVLPSPGLIIFRANRNLWRARINGSELTQLTTTDREDGDLWPALPGTSI
jgi:hypothetical protein